MQRVRTAALAAASVLFISSNASASGESPAKPATSPTSTTAPRPIMGKIKSAQAARGSMGGGMIEAMFRSDRGYGQSPSPSRGASSYAPAYSSGPFYSERTAYGASTASYSVEEDGYSRPAPA